MITTVELMNLCDESEEEMEEVTGSVGELKFIAEELENFPEILSKSQMPKIKLKKDECIKELLKKYAKVFGKQLDGMKLMKKINNMKSRLKQKTDMSKTRYKPIKLNDWQRVMLKAMQRNTNSINQIHGTVQCRFSTRNKNASSSSTGNNLRSMLSSNASPKQGPQKNNNILDETDETKDLSNSDLQRLVLLEQLKTIRLQGEYYNELLQRKTMEDYILP